MCSNTGFFPSFSVSFGPGLSQGTLCFGVRVPLLASAVGHPQYLGLALESRCGS